MRTSVARQILNLAERRDLYQEALRLITPTADCPVAETYSCHLRLKSGSDGVYVSMPTPLLQGALRDQIKAFQSQIEELKRGT